MARSVRPVRRVERHPDAAVDPAAWPDSVPAVHQLLTRGLDLPAGVIFLVGENGAGKSTVVEAVAEAVGVHPDGGGSAHRAGGARSRGTDRSGLAARLRVVSSPGGTGGAFFLRAETMHRFYSYLEDAAWDGEGEPTSPHPLHGVSHGEGFVEVLQSRWLREARLVLLDEPESALSFDNCLLLAGSLARMADDGKQVLCATHSPLLTALPGATVLQLDEDGITPTTWEELTIVRNWRFFLDAPQRYLRHVL
ncbi:AAA family ATPase [Kineococcus rubinsiae]|uniref:AAA family ATPase n=1 Tax=Kineococcus rubinsiae TaxID=2609562 RepID=UPI001431FCD3|nr:AAA family ATPase [Kineococcus rubinsiae]NIZ92734.1 ATP-binding cassette domain-containing protein [Kineococcus rubinsiae]